jgi:hypothetical protein
MPDEGLFREQALRRWREGGTKGEVLRLAPGWTTRAVAALVVVAVGAALAACFVTVPLSLQGPATVAAEGRVLALLPAARRSALRPRALMVYRGDGRREDVSLLLERIEARVVGPDEARTLAGGAFAHGAVPDAAVVVWAVSATPDAPPPGTGRVTVPLGRRRLIDLLVPRIR